jgi:hypothetical protein
MGVLTFAVVVLGVIPAPQANANENMLTVVSLAFAVLSGVMSVVIRRVVVATQRKKIAEGTWTPPSGTVGPKNDVEMLLACFQTQTIIGAALLEGGAFFALVAYMQERQTWSLLAAAVLLAGLMTLFPTRGRVESWLDDELRRVQELRHLGS